MQVKLTRAKLEQLVDDLLQRTMAPVKQALADAGVDPGDRRGGAGRRLDAHAKSAAARARVLRQGAAQGVNPDEVVAVGAAVQGGVMTGDSRT